MKKLAFISLAAALILTGGCGEKQEINNGKQVTKIEDKKEVLSNISFSGNLENMPDYKDLKTKNMYEKLLIIHPDNDRESLLIAKAVSADILRTRNQKSELKKDKEVNKEDLISNNLIIIGNTKNNRVIKELEKYLPAKADGEKVEVNGKIYKGENSGVTYIYPNLYNFNNLMMMMHGNSGKALKMADFTRYDMIVFDGIKEIMPVNYKEKAFVKFDQKWRIKNIEEVSEEMLKTGEEVKIEIPEIKEYKFPEWAKGNVIYEIFVRSFADSNGDGRGDLNGITSKLDYLKEIGVDIIWLTPIFDSPSYHGYDIRNYFEINKEYGTMEDFRKMVKEIHKRKMKIVLDVAFNHASSQEVHFRDAYNNPESKYDKWFYFGNIQNTIYHDWYFRENHESREVVDSKLPAWNVNNPEVIDFHTEVAKFWFDPDKDGDFSDGVDGYRLDVVKGPPHDYWKVFRQKVKEIKEDALLIGEAWVDLDDMIPYFNEEMDTVFDFPLQGSMTAGIIPDITKVIEEQKKKFPENTNFARFMSNHDMDRFTNYIEVPKLKLYSTFLYTINGLPVLYYGDEIGAKGDGADGDPGRRRPMEWTKNNKGPEMTRWTNVYSPDIDGISVEEQDGKKGSLLEHYKKIAKIRKKYLDIFAEGKVEFLLVNELKDGKESNSRRVLAYTVKGKEKTAIIVLNFGNKGNYKIQNLENFKGKYKEVLNDKDDIKIDNNAMDMQINKDEVYIYIQK